MAERRRERERRRKTDGSLVRGTLVSALLHALAVVLVLLAPHRMRAAPPTAYTVELVDPDALGGKLLAGPIGSGSASRKAVPPPRVEPPPPPPPPPPPEPPHEQPEPEEVAKAEPPQSQPPQDEDAVPLGKVTPVPPPTRVAPTARPMPTAHPTAKPAPSPIAVAKAKPSAIPAKPTSTPAPLARRAAPNPSPSPASRVAAHDETKDRAAGSIDDQLAAAIKGVETRVGKAGTPGLSGAGPGGGQGGTERTLNGPASVGGEGPGGGGAVRGLEFVMYYNQMLTKIKESWTYVGQRNDLRVTVRFSILDSGEITDIRLTERSGDPGYDASVERAVKRAGPLAPPPQAYRKDFADVELTFRPADLRRPSG